MRLVQIESEEDVERLRVGDLLYIQFPKQHSFSFTNWESGFVVVTGKDKWTPTIEIKNNTIRTKGCDWKFTNSLNFTNYRPHPSSGSAKYFLIILEDEVFS
jgi:glucose dehydrogenase